MVESLARICREVSSDCVKYETYTKKNKYKPILLMNIPSSPLGILSKTPLSKSQNAVEKRFPPPGSGGKGHTLEWQSSRHSAHGLACTTFAYRRGGCSEVIKKPNSCFHILLPSSVLPRSWPSCLGLGTPPATYLSEGKRSNLSDLSCNLSDLRQSGRAPETVHHLAVFWAEPTLHRRC